MKNVHLTEDQRMEACTLAIEGKDPKAYLEGLGCPNPDQSWGSCKGWFKQHYPEQFDKIPARINKPKAQKVKPPVVKIDGPIRIETPEANKVEIVEKPEKKPVPEKYGIHNPLMYDQFTVREVEGLFGRYRYSDIGSAVYIDYENTEGVDVLSLTVDQWRRFREEQEKAAAILGVEL